MWGGDADTRRGDEAGKRQAEPYGNFPDTATGSGCRSWKAPVPALPATETCDLGHEANGGNATPG